MSTVPIAGRNLRTFESTRAAERYAVSAKTSCQFAHPLVETTGPVQVRDVSMDGVGLLLTHRVEVGAMLAVGLANPVKEFAKTVLVRVAHVTQTSGGFLVGGSFLTPLSYQEMTSLIM